MSTSIPSTKINPVETPSLSLKERIQHNWKNHKVQVIASASVSAASTAGAVVLGTVLGGPIGAIIALAAVAFLALANLVRALISQPKNVVPLKTASAEIQVKEESKPTETTKAATPEPKPVQKQNRIASVVNSMKAHPYRTALGAVALASGVGAGIYAYGALASAPAIAKTVATAVPVVATNVTNSTAAATAYGVCLPKAAPAAAAATKAVATAVAPSVAGGALVSLADVLQRVSSNYIATVLRQFRPALEKPVKIAGFIAAPSPVAKCAEQVINGVSKFVCAK